MIRCLSLQIRPTEPTVFERDAPHRLIAAVFTCRRDSSKHNICSSMGWACLKPHAEGAVLRLRVTPNASRTSAEGLRQDRLGLRVNAPPVEGKANRAVCKWAAKTFGIKESGVPVSNQAL